MIRPLSAHGGSVTPLTSVALPEPSLLALLVTGSLAVCGLGFARKRDRTDQDWRPLSAVRDVGVSSNLLRWDGVISAKAEQSICGSLRTRRTTTSFARRLTR